MSGPTAGGPLEKDDPAPRAVSEIWFDIVCPESERRRIRSIALSSDIREASEWYIRASSVEANFAMRHPLHDRRERATHDSVYENTPRRPCPSVVRQGLARVNTDIGDAGGTRCTRFRCSWTIPQPPNTFPFIRT
jgi:hypothetical protein